MTTHYISNTVNATAIPTDSVGIEQIHAVEWTQTGIAIAKKNGTTVTYTGATSDEADFLQMKLELDAGQGKTFARVTQTNGKPRYIPHANVKTMTLTTNDGTNYQATLELRDGGVDYTELTTDVSRITQFN